MSKINKSDILTIFNKQFIELIEDIGIIFPNDADLVKLKNFFILIKKSNPKIIITIFHKNVVEKYKKQILEGDISYFIEKDYSNDLKSSNNSEQIIEAIDRLRDSIRIMNEKNKITTIKYLQNLCKLADTYINS